MTEYKKILQNIQWELKRIMKKLKKINLDCSNQEPRNINHEFESEVSASLLVQKKEWSKANKNPVWDSTI